jgi:hypothetical protein
MIPLALILLAAATRLELVDEVLRIPAGDWRYVELGLKQQAAFVAADFEVQSGSQPVKLELMRHEDLDRLRADRPNGVIAATALAASGRLLYRVRVPGDYVVVIDNRNANRNANGNADGREAVARLRVVLDFGARPGPQVTRLSPQRQFTVILISFAVFFGIVTYSARRLLRGIRR